MISFFGGEPLLNWEGIKTGIDHCNLRNKDAGKKIIFYLTTNGTLLKREYLDFLAKYDVRITISLDGDRDVNDRHRFFADGGSAFYETVRAVRLIVEYPEITLQVRPTVDEYGSSRIVETANFLTSIGASRIHFRPMSSINGTKLALTKNGYQMVGEGFEKLAQHMIEQAKNGEKIIGYINILKFLFLLFFRLRRKFYCGAGNSVISIDPSGNISPCPRFTGMESFKIGELNCGGIINDRKENFQTKSVKNRPDCDNCWVKNICSGGCLYMQDIDGQGIGDFSVWCELIKSNVTSAIKTFFSLHEISPLIISNLAEMYPPLLSNMEGALLGYKKHLK